MTLSVWTITRKSLITKYAVVMLARATRQALLQTLANIFEGEFMSSIGNFEERPERWSLNQGLC